MYCLETGYIRPKAESSHGSGQASLAGVGRVARSWEPGGEAGSFHAAAAAVAGGEAWQADRRAARHSRFRPLSSSVRTDVTGCPPPPQVHLGGLGADKLGRDRLALPR